MLGNVSWWLRCSDLVARFVLYALMLSATSCYTPVRCFACLERNTFVSLYSLPLLASRPFTIA
jgi:hypothetical protein